jgi:MHS family proline/betaine transporter-like MFS transporter
MISSVVTKEEKRTLWLVILASSVGTLIEWYDFYIFGSLATILSQQFFPQTNPTAAFLSTLATFAAGFVVRPFGAIVFGRLGDLVGRKYTFLVTLILMGGSTFAIGLVPGYQSIGIFAPIIVLVLRLLQGLALGGEYGGAATYVAEHAPAAKRGYYTSYIQTTATLGLFVSIGVILAVREWVGVSAFNDWGWRVPFILSALLVGISIFIRMRMKESPLFSKIKSEGKISKNPIKESFGKKENLMMVLLALFGATAGQGVVWYTGQFYAMTFIEKTCMVDFVQTRDIIAIALVIGTPFFIVFGSWSDRVGRKYIMMVGMILAVFLYRPIYKEMMALTDLKSKVELEDQRSIEKKYSVENAKDSLITIVKRSSYSDETQAIVTTTSSNGEQIGQPKTEISLHGMNYWMMIALVAVQVFLVTMVYGPIAAFLVEMFPTRIRYTSMSLPYHIGNGIFGGLTPFIATYLATTMTDPLAGLWYPILVSAITFVIGMIFLSNRKRAEVME